MVNTTTSMDQKTILENWRTSGLSELLGERDHYGYEDTRWLVFLRDHGGKDGVLKNAKPHVVDRFDAMRYRGNFFGYLKSLNHGEIGHWINMTINGLKHPTEFDERVQLVYLIDDYFLMEWHARYHEVTFKHEDTELAHPPV